MRWLLFHCLRAVILIILITLVFFYYYFSSCTYLCVSLGCVVASPLYFHILHRYQNSGSTDCRSFSRLFVLVRYYSHLLLLLILFCILTEMNQTVSKIICNGLRWIQSKRKLDNNNTRMTIIWVKCNKHTNSWESQMECKYTLWCESRIVWQFTTILSR